MQVDAASFAAARPILAKAAFAALAELRERFDVVICEGAGSPTEINLRAHDFVNMGLARRADIPVIVAGDIDRGGVFAALHGTLALLSAEDQRLVSGFVINKFRGDVGLLRPGLDTIEGLTGRPVLGVDSRGTRICGSMRRTPSRTPTAGSSGGRRHRTGRSGCGWPPYGSRGSRTPPMSRRSRPSRASRCG